MVWETVPTAGGWEFTDPDIEGGGTISIEYIQTTGRGLQAWVEVSMPGYEIPLSEGNTDLMRPGAIRPFLRDARSAVKDLPWEEGLRYAFHEVIEAHRDGAATQDLTKVIPADIAFLVDPLVESGGSTRLVAAGGSGKSIFAMAACLTVATGRRFLQLDTAIRGAVLYIDYETDADTHARRIAALCAPYGADLPEPDQLLYRFESAPLFRGAQAIRRVCDKYDVKMIVVDSRQMAAGPSSQGAAEDSTLNLYLGLREIGRPALIVDHKTKADIAQGRRGGYGSVFNENLARLQWEMTKLVDLSPTERTFVLELSKQNNVGALPPLGFKMTTEGGRTGITSAQFIKVDPAELPDPDFDDMTDRIAALLSGSAEPLTVTRIGDLLYGHEEARHRRASIRTRLNQDPRFENISETNVGAWRIVGDTRATGEQTEMRSNDKWDGEVF